jgi:hypothetical protein
MGLWDRIKYLFGGTGVEIALEVADAVDATTGRIEGVLRVTAKKAATLDGFTVKLLQERTTGRLGNNESKEEEIGELTVEEELAIGAGETREIPFVLPFVYKASDFDALKEKGGLSGALGSAAKWATNERFTWKLTAEVEISSTLLNPTAERPVALGQGTV